MPYAELPGAILHRSTGGVASLESIWGKARYRSVGVDLAIISLICANSFADLCSSISQWADLVRNRYYNADSEPTAYTSSDKSEPLEADIASRLVTKTVRYATLC